MGQPENPASRAKNPQQFSTLLFPSVQLLLTTRTSHSSPAGIRKLCISANVWLRRFARFQVHMATVIRIKESYLWIGNSMLVTGFAVIVTLEDVNSELSGSEVLNSVYY